MIVNEDITQIKIDAIVNAANPELVSGGGVCGQIFAKAGKLLAKDCAAYKGCPVGEAKITFGYKLPAKYVIHAVGPVWQGGGAGEPALLRGAYEYSMELAVTHDNLQVAFPLISSGIYGYPKDLAFHEAVVSLGGYLMNSREIDTYLSILPEGFRPPYCQNDLKAPLESFLKDGGDTALFSDKTPPSGSRPVTPLPEFLANLQKVKGWSKEELARRANLRVSELDSVLEPPEGAGKPPKNWILALALAFGVSGTETVALLESIGMSLDPKSVTDLTVAFFLEKGITDVYLVSEASYTSGGDFLGALPKIVRKEGPGR
ncbi:MAG: macro domain-containing protein [Deltaproteobacteria bacterium]|jgi:O-acetyl-ADP-ribose deacetylase (regulator of RNase III)|nr:macro domain-containing protein [Deltaproteobacteria bacterium]